MYCQLRHSMQRNWTNAPESSTVKAERAYPKPHVFRQVSVQLSANLPINDVLLSHVANTYVTALSAG